MGSTSIVTIVAFGMLALWSTFLWKQVNINLASFSKDIKEIRKDLEQAERQWFASFNALKKRLEELESEIGSFSAINDKD